MLYKARLKIIEIDEWSKAETNSLKYKDALKSAALSKKRQ